MTTLDPTDPRTDTQLLHDTGWSGFWDETGRPVSWPDEAFDTDGNLTGEANLHHDHDTDPAIRMADLVIHWYETGETPF
ncbi:hypothetical protein [Promicromonospora sp. NPDC023987]|uniref:hypothetical protein n=1 Tax=Promicromonospora sp. NPDC023987 TaxID=3155360 RepID=UPI0033D3D4F7